MGRNIEADYLVVGAGAMGLAFADTLVSESDATVVVVDRNDQPGGHWTTAYPFVRLHQLSGERNVDLAVGHLSRPRVDRNAAIVGAAHHLVAIEELLRTGGKVHVAGKDNGVFGLIPVRVLGGDRWRRRRLQIDLRERGRRREERRHDEK